MHPTMPIRTAKTGYMIMSVLSFALGILIICFPGIPKVPVCRMIGGFLCGYGIIKVIGYFARDLYRLAFQFDLAYGTFIALLGIILMIFTQNFVLSLSFILGLIVLADALLKVQTAMDAKKFGIGKWWLIAVCSAAAGIPGILLLTDPYGSSEFARILSGIALILEGILNFLVAVYMVKIVKNQVPETK